MKYILLIVVLTISTAVYSENSRLYQFVAGEENRSFLSLEVGTSSGINLILNRMQASFLYSVTGLYGISISTDLFLFEHNFTESFKIKLGFGGGIIFKSEIDYFESNALLRIPVNLEYNNLYLSFVPMYGSTMFEYYTRPVVNLSINIGYKFDLYRDKDKKEDI